MISGMPVDVDMELSPRIKLGERDVPGIIDAVIKPKYN